MRLPAGREILCGVPCGVQCRSFRLEITYGFHGSGT